MGTSMIVQRPIGAERCRETRRMRAPSVGGDVMVPPSASTSVLARCCSAVVAVSRRLGDDAIGPQGSKKGDHQREPNVESLAHGWTPCVNGSDRQHTAP